MRLMLLAEIPGWNALKPGRDDQHFRNELVKALRIVCDAIANNGNTNGGLDWPTVTLNYRLEPAVDKSAADEAA